MVTQNNNKHIIQQSIMGCGDIIHPISDEGLLSPFEISIEKHIQNCLSHFSTPSKQRGLEPQITGRVKRQRVERIESDEFIFEKISSEKKNIFEDISKFIRKRACERCACHFCECD